MAAVTQIRYAHSDGRAYYDKKIAEGKTPKEALRALKRKISDALYKHLKADAARAAAPGNALRPGRAPGERLFRQPLPDLPHPRTPAFGQATPGPPPPPYDPGPPPPRPRAARSRGRLLACPLLLPQGPSRLRCQRAAAGRRAAARCASTLETGGTSP